MSGLGEKIKEVLTGHSSQKGSSDVKTPDVNAPGAYPSDEKTVIETHTNLTKAGHQHRDNEIGAGHTQGRHDPEVEAKEATSQAGNYPYWGDLPQETEQGHSRQPGTAAGGSLGEHSSNLQKDSGLSAGALATGAGATGAGASGIGSRTSEYEHRPLGTQDTTSTTQNLTDRTRDPGLTSSTQTPATTTQGTRDGHKGELAAATGAGVAGAAGATYLSHRHNDEDSRAKATSDLSSGPAHAGPGSLDPGYASQTSSSTTKPQEFTNIASKDSPYSTHDNGSHRKEEGALAAGAGAAGLGGAGYLAHKRADEQPKTAYGSQQQTSGLTSSTDSPYATTHGDHSHRKEEGALAAGAGAAGLGGAGYLAHKRAEDPSRLDERPTTVHSSQQRDTTSSGFPSSQSTTGGGIHNTVVGAGSAEDPYTHSHRGVSDSNPLSSSNTTTAGSQSRAVDPREQQTISSALGGSSSGNDRERQGLGTAAGVGAGAGALAAEEKHRHHEHRQHDDKSKEQGHSLFGSSHKHDDKAQHDRHAHPAQSATSSQPSAQLAAQQAWNKQNQGSTGTHHHDPESEARQATSAAGNYPYQSDTPSSTSNTGHHHNAALGAAAGAGLAGAGATAAYYGQGPEHDQNPRSSESQKIAERALGSDGAAHAPGSGQDYNRGVTGGSTNPGLGSSSTGAGSTALSGGLGHGSSKVVHKCHQCGADNDISDYFKKEAGIGSRS